MSKSRSSLSPEVQAVFDRLGYYIRHYPELSTLMGNSNFSIVFSRLLYHEDLRLKRNAAFFAGTDPQLSAECGLGEYEFGRARDLICAPGIALFVKERHGVPPINHYCGNYPRIHAWLTANGYPMGPPAPSPAAAMSPPDSNSLKNHQLKAGKTANQKAEKPASLKNLFEEFSDVDDARVARINAAEELLKAWGIENPTRQRILDRLGNREDIVDVIKGVCESTSQQWAEGVARKREVIKRPAGLIVSRLLNEVEP